MPSSDLDILHLLSTNLPSADLALLRDVDSVARHGGQHEEIYVGFSAFVVADCVWDIGFRGVETLPVNQWLAHNKFWGSGREHYVGHSHRGPERSSSSNRT